MRPHGYARYRLDGCRCYECAFARSEYDCRRDAMIKAGTWQPFVPIGPVRDKLLVLKRQCGFGDRLIAELLECDRKWVRDTAAGIRHDPTRNNPPVYRVRTERAAAVMALPVDILWAADGAYVPAWKVWRWIDKLLAAGYTKSRISAEIGQDGRALQLSRKRVTGKNARAVYAVYVANFPEHRSRDEIDWVRVQRVLDADHSDGITLTTGEKKEAIRTLHGMGMCDRPIAARIHTDERTVLRIRQELGLSHNYEFAKETAA